MVDALQQFFTNLANAIAIFIIVLGIFAITFIAAHVTMWINIILRKINTKNNKSTHKNKLLIIISVAVQITVLIIFTILFIAGK